MRRHHTGSARIRVSAGDVATTTHEDGAYLLVLPPGSFRVSVSAASFTTSDQTVDVESGMVHIRNWQLLPAP